MQVLFKNIKNDLKQYNKISLYILKYGTFILVILSLIAIITKIMILYSETNIPMIFFYEDLLECIKEGFSSIYPGAMILEFLHLLTKNTAAGN